MQHHLRWKWTILFQIKQNISWNLIVDGMLLIWQNLNFFQSILSKPGAVFHFLPPQNAHQIEIQASQTLDPTFFQHCVSPTQSSWTGRMRPWHISGLPSFPIMANPRKRTHLWGVGYMRHPLCWCLVFGKKKVLIQKIPGLFSLPDVGWEAAFNWWCGVSIFETRVIGSRSMAFMWAGWIGEKSPEEDQQGINIPLYVVMEEKTG